MQVKKINFNNKNFTGFHEVMNNGSSSEKKEWLQERVRQEWNSSHPCNQIDSISNKNVQKSVQRELMYQRIINKFHSDNLWKRVKFPYFA
ncbi:hypothetical protein J6G99_08600 [bacterium]|nr:hypothetical protein [bacterium]